MSENLDRGPLMKGEAPSRRAGMKFRSSRSLFGLLGGYPGISQVPRSRLGYTEYEAERSDENKVEALLADSPEALEAPNIAFDNKPLVSQAEPNFLKMMEKMAKFMGQITQEVSRRDNFRAPALKTPSMRALDSFGGTQSHELRRFIQYLRKSEKELENMKMKESGHVSLQRSDFISLIARIGDWEERYYIHVYRRSLDSGLLEQLASHPGKFDSLEELVEITLDIVTRLYERQKEKISNKEKKPPVTAPNSFRPPQK
ncbi:hypothetical protein O181_016680 [Austropuccinia psidii MF-1]|uniref:Uncharacterized protein n=1 Tax=Austropuccinia psidii MF-1 TaxID=1389203 RepID=A0A9Q3GS84_9BASI|nr:hypothetical protein [Austropuccinia psidii MF-1]